MIRVFIDTNIFLNVWIREVDPKTGKELWKSSARVLKLIEDEVIGGVTSLTTLMEIVHVFRIRQRDYAEAFEDLRNIGIEIFIPNTFTLLRAFEFQRNLSIDPFDSIALAAVESGCDYLITRDKTFARR